MSVGVYSNLITPSVSIELCGGSWRVIVGGVESIVNVISVLFWFPKVSFA